MLDEYLADVDFSILKRARWRFLLETNIRDDGLGDLFLTSSHLCCGIILCWRKDWHALKTSGILGRALTSPDQNIITRSIAVQKWLTVRRGGGTGGFHSCGLAHVDSFEALCAAQCICCVQDTCGCPTTGFLLLFGWVEALCIVSIFEGSKIGLTQAMFSPA